MSHDVKHTGSSDSAAHVDIFQRADRALLAIIDLAMAATIIVAPYFMGGRHPVGRIVVIGLAVLMASAWSCRRLLDRRISWVKSSADWLLIAGVAVIAIQLLPFSEQWLSGIAPGRETFLSNVTVGGIGEEGARTWNRISMYPTETSYGLMLFLAHGMLLWVTIQRIRSLADVERLLKWVAASAGLMAMFGIVQFLTTNGKFFWFYENPFRHTRYWVKGMFFNRNHFAHFLALGAGPLIWWIQHRIHMGDRSSHVTNHGFPARKTAFTRVGFLWLLMAIMAFATLMTLSRGGAIVFLSASLFCVVLYFQKNLLDRKAALAGVAMLALVGGSLAIHGMGLVSNRLDDFATGDLDRQHQRRDIYLASLAGVKDFPAFGTGVGTFREVYPVYLPYHSETEYVFAESSFMQIAVETGLAGLAIAGLAVLLTLGRGVRALFRNQSQREFAALTAVMASLLASAAHAVFDFVWHVPALMTMTVVLVACCIRLVHLQKRASASNGGVSETTFRNVLNMPGDNRLGFCFRFAMPVLVCGLGLWMVRGSLPRALAVVHWENYLRLSLAHSDFDPTSVEQRRAVEQMIDELEKAVAIEPEDARTQVRLAAAYMRHFDQVQMAAFDKKSGAGVNEMTVYDFRDAAMTGQFVLHAVQLMRSWDKNGDQRIERSEYPEPSELERPFHEVDHDRDNNLSVNEIRQASIAAWLARATDGRSRFLYRALARARRGLALCPLQGDAYLTMAKTVAFVDVDVSLVDQYVERAEQLRPHDPNVLLDAGMEASKAILRTTDMEQRTHYAKLLEDRWRRCFQNGEKYQRRILQLVGSDINVVKFMLDRMQPDIAALRVMRDHYQKGNHQDVTRMVVGQLAKQAESEAAELTGIAAAALWSEALISYETLEAHDQALVCAHKAIESGSTDFDTRKKVGLYFLREQHFADAETQLQWCCRRHPNDQAVQQSLRQARKGRMTQPRSKTVTSNDRNVEQK